MTRDPSPLDALTREALAALHPEPGKHPIAHLRPPGATTLMSDADQAALREVMAELRGRLALTFEQAVDKVIALCRDAATDPDKFDAIIETHIGKGH